MVNQLIMSTFTALKQTTLLKIKRQRAMKHSEEQIKEIMLALYEQLGRHKFVVMTGSKFTGYMENESGDLEQVIKLSKNKSGADKLIITYEEGKDTYSMRFIKSPKLNKKTFSFSEAKEVFFLSDIYAEQLQEVFTQVTGLYTHL